MSANPATFSEIVKLANLESVRAVSLSADAENAEGLRGHSSLNVSVNDECEWTLSDERDDLVVLVLFEVNLSRDDVAASFSASIRYEVVYHFDHPLSDDPKTDEALGGFARANPRFNAWPFLREYVNYVSSYCELPSIMLPLMKPFAKRKDVGTTAANEDSGGN